MKFSSSRIIRIIGTPVTFLAASVMFQAAAALAQPAPPAQPAAKPCTEALPDLYDRVSPAVVSISAISINPYDVDHRIDRVVGSGVLIDASGLVATNSHVVYGRQVIAVTLDDGTTLPAQLVGADPLFDIAVVRIPGPTRGTLPVAALADSSHLQVGEEVYAIGNPLGLNQTLTRGIVSAVNRLLPGAAWSLTEPLIQTDAALNPGNSGGPLVDKCGEVVGITTALLSEAQNIGFAVPSNLVRAVMPELLQKGRIVRPWLGVQGQLIAPILKELLRVPLVDGFLVEALDPGSPAEQQGVLGGRFELTINGEPILLGGDIVTKVNGIAITEVETLGRTLGGLKVGDPVRLTLARETKTLTVDLVVAERPLLPWDIPGRRPSAGGAGQVGPTGANPAGRTRTIVF